MKSSENIYPKRNDFDVVFFDFILELVKERIGDGEDSKQKLINNISVLTSALTTIVLNTIVKENQLEFCDDINHKMKKEITRVHELIKNKDEEIMKNQKFYE